MSDVIVCGIDLSRGSASTAAVAARIAGALGSRAVVAHVDGEPPGVASLARAHELRELRALADRHGFPEGTLARLANGPPAERLAGLARNHDAELLVVGSRGLGELRSALVGSVSDDLVRAAPCPVVVVPPRLALPFPHPGMRSIVCGVEGSENDGALLRFGADLAARLGADFHAVHGFDPRPLYAMHTVPIAVGGLREAAEARLERALDEAGVSARSAVVSEPAATALAQAVVERGAGLIVIGSRGSSRFGSLLRGSVLARLRARLKCPIVVLPSNAEIACGSGHYELTADAA